ncbi:MAG: choice-of-anchor J domain-containing protein [Urechidicola sp.]|nr:choice-of-anchor J domain-containing protein [Urechidicola sp.]
MKTIKFLKLISLAAIAALAVSCVQDDEYDIPDVGGTEPDVTVNSSIGAVRSAWDQHNGSTGEEIYTFPTDTGDLFLAAYVVSSDYGGNFYKTLVVQDSPENPEFGIEVLVDKTSLFESYEVGRKVYIKLNGLSVSYDDGDDNDPNDGTPGRYSLGSLIDGSVDDMSAFLYEEHILRSTEVATIVPTVVSIDDFSQENLNTMIQIQGMQFPLNELGKTYAGEANDQFDGFRILLNCADESTATLQTSTFSDFKSHVIPDGQGSITAVLAKDFRADFFVMIINNPTNVDFSSPDRCDPVILDCGNGAVGGSVVLFDEDFEGTSEGQLITDGWINENVNGGSNDFSLRSFSGNSYMQASAFRTGENPMEVWLISPEIDLDTTTDEELTFETKVGYHNGDALSVFVSTDFTGDIDSATWALVDADLADSPSNGYGSTFTESGSINISCLEGNVVVAFRYLGADSGITTTFQIENVKVTGN